MQDKQREDGPRSRESTKQQALWTRDDIRQRHFFQRSITYTNVTYFTFRKVRLNVRNNYDGWYSKERVGPASSPSWASWAIHTCRPSTFSLTLSLLRSTDNPTCSSF